VYSLFHSLRTSVTPVLQTSKFTESGVLTPEEFVQAGDFLVFKCPTWSWASGVESKRVSYLPPDKQYLITRNVPCAKRVKQMEYTGEADESFIHDDGDKEGDGWISTHQHRDPNDGHTMGTHDLIQEIHEDDIDDRHYDHKSDNQTKSQNDNNKKKTQENNSNLESIHTDMRNLSISKGNTTPHGEDAIPDMDDIPDIDEFDESMGAGVVEEEDEATLNVSKSIGNTNSGDHDTNDNILRTRTYDISITYDKVKSVNLSLFLFPFYILFSSFSRNIFFY